MYRHWPTQPAALMTVFLIVITTSLTVSISCYDCEYNLKHNFKKKIVFETDGEDCLWLNSEETNTSRECQAHEDACYVYQIKRNDVIIHYRRNCVKKKKCLHGCAYEGFGYLEEMCTFCCNVTECNDQPAGNASYTIYNLLTWLSTIVSISFVYVIGR